MVRFVISLVAVFAAVPAAAKGPSDAISAVTAAWARHDSAAITREFVPDAEFVAVDGSVFDGAKQIGQVFTALFAGRYAGTTLSLDAVGLRPIAPHVVYVRGDFAVTKAAPLDCGHFFALLREQDGVWRVATYHEVGATCSAVR